MKSVHQIVIGAAKHDAITNMAFEIQKALRNDFHSEIFAYHAPSRDLASQIRMLRDLPRGTRDDKIIYHLSFGIPEVTELILERDEEIILHYHNVTPSKQYQLLMPEFAEALDYGRLELELLTNKAEKVLADSMFNADELRNLGYQKIIVLPAGLNPRRLDTEPIDPSFLMKIERDFPNGFILFVSQVLPHKRVDHALAMVHLLRSVHRLDVGLVVAGPIRQPAYMNALNQFRELLNDCHVLFTDAVTDSQLATLYRACTCYVGTSEHEGLSIPPLEAMSNLAPVVVRGAGAVPETVGEGGIVLGGDVGVLEFTETVAAVVNSPELQSTLRRRGLERVQVIENDFGNTALSKTILGVIQ